MPNTPWVNRIVRYGEEDPSQLVASPWNWRIHPHEQEQALQGVLSEVGYVAPVIVSVRSGYVVDGHLRVAAAISKGQPTIPVAFVDLDEAEEKLILSTLDPIGSLAATDQEKLDELIGELHASDAHLVQFLASLRTETPKVLGEDTADLTPPAEPVTKAGDLWLLGEHRLLCGDSTKAEDVARLMDGQQADVILADPPYGINLDTDFSTIHGSLRSIGASHGTRGNTYAPIIGDGQPFDARPIFDHFGGAQEMFLFGADYYSDGLVKRDAGSWLVWDKRKESQSEAVGSEFELIWSKQRHKRRVLRHDWFGFLSSANTTEARNRQHPTQKPTSLLRDILEQWSKPTDLVIDPYAGIGSTIVACDQTGRNCYAMEIDPSYCDVAVRRWETLTGRSAVLAEPALVGSK